MLKITACYARVSTVEQARGGWSIDEQVERLQSFCQAMGWKEVKTYIDAGFTGGNTDRPALQEILKDIQQGKIRRVVVYKLDRLSRSQKDTLDLIEDRFLANEVDFISITENFDTSSPFGRAMIGILAVFAQLEREQIKERMTMGRTARAKAGKYHGGGITPVGYEYLDGHLIVNEWEALQIRELFGLYISGASFREIERTFLAKGYTHKHGKWNIKTIRVCLTNSLYAGKVKFAGEEHQGTHAAIVSESVFLQAQKIHAQKMQKHTKDTSGGQLLSGLLFCSRCGARYGTARENCRNYAYYSCYSRRKQNLAMIKDPNCKNKHYRTDLLDGMILGEVRKLALDPSELAKIARRSPDKPETENRAVLIQEEIKAVEKQISRFLDLYGLGRFTVEELTSKTDPLDQKKKRLQQELEALQKSEDRLDPQEAQKLIESFEDVVSSGSKPELKILLRSLIRRIEIDGDDITILWSFS